MKKCPNCGIELEDFVTFCPICGVSTPLVSSTPSFSGPFSMENEEIKRSSTPSFSGPFSMKNEEIKRKEKRKPLFGKKEEKKEEERKPLEKLPQREPISRESLREKKAPHQILECPKCRFRIEIQDINRVKTLKCPQCGFEGKLS